MILFSFHNLEKKFETIWSLASHSSLYHIRPICVKRGHVRYICLHFDNRVAWAKTISEIEFKTTLFDKGFITWLILIQSFTESFFPHGMLNFKYTSLVTLICIIWQYKVSHIAKNSFVQNKHRLVLNTKSFLGTK